MVAAKVAIRYSIRRAGDGVEEGLKRVAVEGARHVDTQADQGRSSHLEGCDVDAVLVEPLEEPAGALRRRRERHMNFNGAARDGKRFAQASWPFSATHSL